MSTQKPKWQIEGEYFESCNCEVLCPCLLTGARPTEGHCDVVLGFHIDKGNYGGTDLAGLNAVQALTTPDVMSRGNGTLAVYVDSRATADQRAALEDIFTGAAGGPPSLFGPMVTKLLPTKSAPITFGSQGSKRTLSIANVTEVTVEGVAGAGKQVVWMENVAHPYSTRLAIARGTASQYKDHGLNFENTGRNGHFSHISWSNA
ncbi:MAG TPA: DUF1326 domain-containing protein [Candidatus Binataceae bacterium]|nr:DUF1326 domain-containing protein [Candidatus Binataceae bacterium]